MQAKWFGVLVFLVLFLLATAAPAQADGIIIPPPCPLESCPPPPCPGPGCPPIPPRPMEQLEIRYHHVTVSIQDQLALTRVDQVFYNPNHWALEGTYVFPLPLDAVVSNFTLWVDGKPVTGEVLDAQQARQYYEETVRKLRDPALLEYEGRGAVRAAIFPIPPEGERRIALEYSQALTAHNGLVKYSYPLNTEKFSARPLDDVTIRVEIADRQEIRALYSPSHPVAQQRKDGRHVIASYEAKNVRPDSDFTLYYSIGESQAFHLFSYRNPADPGDPDGFFLLLLAPKPGETQAPIAKDVLLVLDRSGSMDGEKFRQAQAALRYILQKLHPDDRFYLQAFSTGIETYASGLRPASEAPEALAWVDHLSAAGSTDIHRALFEAAAVADPARPTYLIFLTDGLPTEGVTDRPQILQAVAQAAPPNLKLFAFGVGYDVDTLLLDALSQAHHGQSTYVRPGEALDEALAAFYERISTPVLTDLKLDFGALAPFDVYPNPLPDLFAGSQVVVVGRYREGGTVDVTLEGQVNGAGQAFRYPGQAFRSDSRGEAGSLEMLPRLWATRKIGYLLNQVRMQGADRETIQQIIQLSVRYGILTEYTAYLVTEPMPLGAAAQQQMATEAFGQAAGAPAEVTGQGAVNRAAQESQLKSADQAPQAALGGGAGQGGGTENSGAAIRVAGPRTFVLQGQAWVDTAFDPQTMRAQPVVFLSEDYFHLLAARPDLKAALALGSQVTVVVEGQAYQVVDGEQNPAPVLLPQTLAPTLPPTSAVPALAPTLPPTSAVPALAPTLHPTPAAAAHPAQGALPRQGLLWVGLVPLGLLLGTLLLLRLRK